MDKKNPINYKYCVIIPTYNNHKTLKEVIDNVIIYIPEQDIIIVNDGSTDTTTSILKEYQNIHLIAYEKNQGKGFALRKGFKKALELGYTHVISLDSDGQHFPEDIPDFIAAFESEPETLFIGSRNMEHEDVPSKSSFGNKFSNFWFKFETGIKLTDTQSGFRLYPIHCMPKRWFTKKFEFEIEVLVRSAWKDIPVKNIPIQVKYEKEGRITHFRPFIDFSRISVLNTILVLITILYIWPRSLFRRFKKKNIKDFIREDILGSDDSPKVKALSLALGVFIGIIPIWGFQTAVVLFLAVVFRLNKVLAFAASNISIPPMIPVIVFTAIKIGDFVLQRNSSEINLEETAYFQMYIYEYLIGSFILAIFMATLVGLTSYFALSFRRKKTTHHG